MSNSVVYSGDVIHQLERSRTVILEMLENRNFDITSYNNFSRNEIRLMYQHHQCDMVLSDKDDPDKKCVVTYLIYQKVRNNALRSHLEELMEDKKLIPEKTTLIIIVKDKINPSLEKAVSDFNQETKIFSQLFWIKKLLINISRHIAVPKHEIITQDEYQEIAERYQIDSKFQLPLISKEDPMAMYLGMRTGQICKITRPSETAGEYISYRCCR